MLHVGQVLPVVVAAREIDRHPGLVDGQGIELLGGSGVLVLDDLRQLPEELLGEGHFRYDAAHALDVDLLAEGAVLVGFDRIRDVEPLRRGGFRVVVADGVDRHVAVVDRRVVENVGDRERVGDQRRVALQAVTPVDRKARSVERRGVDVALVGGRLVDGRDDVEPLEFGDPLLEAVEAVNRIVALVRALLKHQAVDEFPSLLGRFHGGVRGGGTRLLSVGEGEREEHLVAYGARLDGVEIEVEGRVALGLSAFDGFLGQVFVADDLVYVVELRGKRVAPVAGDGKQDDRRVEDRAEPEISRIDFIGDVLREEPCRAQSERVAEHRTHVPVAEVRRDERVGLVKPRLDIAPGVEIPRQRQGAECLVTRFHLLVVRHEVRPQCVVDLGAARECHRSDDRHDGGGAEQTAEIIESLHRIGCNYRKSPLPRATGIRASVSRSHGRSPIPWGRHLRKLRPHRRHIP